MARVRTARAAFLAAAASATAIGAFRTRAVAQAPRTTLRVGIGSSDGSTAVIYAKTAGLFERAGLDVQIIKQDNGAATAAAIAGGAFDIGGGSITSILRAHTQGLPFVLVAPSSVYDAKAPFVGAIALKDSTLKLGSDANDQVLGILQLNGIGHDAFCAWVDQHGGDPKRLRFVEIPSAAAGPALEKHRAVAVESASPALALALDTGKFRFIPFYSAIAPTFLISACFSTRTFTQSHPDTVRTFARVVAEAARYANGHRAETATMMAAYTGIPVDEMLHVPRAVMGLSLNAELIQPVIAAAAKYGTLREPFPAQDLIDLNVVT